MTRCDNPEVEHPGFPCNHPDEPELVWRVAGDGLQQLEAVIAARRRSERLVNVLHRETPDADWVWRSILPDVHPSLASTAKAGPKRPLWAVVPVASDERDGGGVSSCKWYWTDHGGRMCTRPIGHGGPHVDRVHSVTCVEPVIPGSLYGPGLRLVRDPEAPQV